MKCSRVKTSGKSSSAWRNDQVIGSCQSGDGIQKDHNILLMFYKAACTLHNHLRYTLMMLRKLIKCRIDNLYIRSLYCFLDISNLLWTLVNEKNDQMHVLVILQNGLGNVFEKGGLTCLRRGNDHASLSLSDRTDQIYNTHGCGSARTFHDQTLIRENGGHVLEIVSLLTFAWMETIDGCHIQKGTEFLTLGLDPDISLDNISGLQIKSPDLGRGNINVILTGKIVLASDEAEAIRHNFQNTVGTLTAVQLDGLCRNVISIAYMLSMSFGILANLLWFLTFGLCRRNNFYRANDRLLPCRAVLSGVAVAILTSCILTSCCIAAAKFRISSYNGPGSCGLFLFHRGCFRLSSYRCTCWSVLYHIGSFFFHLFRLRCFFLSSFFFVFFQHTLN